MSAPRIGIIGISGYGKIHLQLARECSSRGQVELCAAVVVNPDVEATEVAALRAAGCRIYATYQAMLDAEALDLCMIPTGIGWHRVMTEAALASGANVLVEKPLAGSVEDAKAIIDAEQKARRFVAVGFQDIYDPAAREVRRLIADGAIGELRSVRLLGMWPRPIRYYERTSWAGRLMENGVAVFDSPLNNGFAHFVTLALAFATRPDRPLRCPREIEAVLRRANGIESFDTAVARGRTADGVRLWFGVTHASARNLEPEILLEGSAGRVLWRHQQDYVLMRPDGSHQRVALRPAEEVRRDMIQTVLARFSDPSAPICTTETALAQVELIAAIHAAAAIRDFNAGCLAPSALAAGSAPVVTVKGLEAALERAASEYSLAPLAELA